MTLELCKAGGDKQKYMAYKFSDVLISSVRPGGSSQGGDALPLEEVSIRFGKVAARIHPDRQDRQATGHGAGGVGPGDEREGLRLGRAE